MSAHRTAARTAAAKFEAIARHYLPRGYTVEYRKGLSGRHYGRRMLIKAPRPVTARALYVFLHECAHAHLHDHSGKVPRHVEEMEAVQWAYAKMKKHGIPVPPSIVEREQRYVAWKIVQAERRGAKRIDDRAREFAGDDQISKMRLKYEKVLGKSRHPNATNGRPKRPS
jgi:hypothetical protein